MKKFTAIAVILFCLTAFASCSIEPAELTDNDSKVSAEKSDSYSQKETADKSQVSEVNNEKSAGSKTDASQNENDSDAEPKQSEPYNQNVSLNDDKSADENNADEKKQYEQLNLEQTAAEQYEKSCEMQWKYIINCPFELDYDDMVGNGYRVKDIDSLSNILCDYNTVFTSCITENGEVSRGDRSAETLQQKYIPAESGLYCIDGGRGKNKAYKSTEFEFISYENDILKLTAISFYEDSEGNVTTKENLFTMAYIDGQWKTYDFTLPY